MQLAYCVAIKGGLHYRVEIKVIFHKYIIQKLAAMFLPVLSQGDK
jgi:hypothetical protein